MVTLHNRRDAMDRVPKPGLIGGVAPAAPVCRICMLTGYVDPMERIVATPNQDVVYGFGLLSLDREPVAVQVPDFGDRVWVYQAAASVTDGFARLGAMYGTKPGLYLLVGPNWQGCRLPVSRRCSGLRRPWRRSRRACSWTTPPRTGGARSRWSGRCMA